MILSQQRPLWLTVGAPSVLLLLCAAAAWIRFPGSLPPYEDAAMLMRYMEHVASGAGIAWNVGHPPTDGATDLLAVLLAAGLMHITGMPAETAVRLLDGASIVAVAAIVLTVSWRRCRSPFLAVFAVAWIILGPILVYTEVYFVTPLFALLALLTWLAAKAARERPEARSGILFAAVAVLLTLDRPEGAFLSAFIALAMLATRQMRLSTFGVFVAVGVICGALYLLWRVHYFGHLLPNPFYIKGQGAVHPHALLAAIRGVLIMAAPFVLILGAGLAVGRLRAQSAAPLLTAALFTMLWLLLSSATNYEYRFQYAIVPLLAVEWPAVAAELALRLPRKGQIASGLILLLLLPVEFHHWRLSPHPDGRLVVGRALAAYAGDHYWMATSEAGLLTFYSGWNDIDTWGLNNNWIAHHGLTPAYLGSHRLAVIMFHAYYSACAPWPTRVTGAWNRMVDTLHQYAVEQHYVLVAVFGVSPTDGHWYYVDPSLPNSGAIEQAITAAPYPWYGNGQIATNYAQACPSAAR